MTREEAIKNIKEHCYFANLIPPAQEALDIAIKALEQEPCEDVVSRQEVLNAIEELKKTYFDRVVVLNKVHDRMLELPPVIPQFGVVPMSIIEDIKAEIGEVGYAKDEYGSIRADVLRVWKVLDIIDKHISGKENK